MSIADRTRWNARYEEGAYAERTHPGVWLVECLARHPGMVGGVGGALPRALDVACGAGRNAVWLAEQGYAVDAVDIAAAGLARAQALALTRSVTIATHLVDLDDGLPPEFDGYDLVVIMRFLDRALFATLPARLEPGGLLLAEVHMQTDATVIGPSGSGFRVAPGELARCFPGLEILALEEGLFADPDGRPVALARLLGRRAE